MFGQTSTLTYAELQQQTAKFAGMLVDLGVKKGDRVIIYMPMIPQAVVAMLGCARLGAIHSVVFGGFAAAELAKRIDDCMPKVMISASCGHEPGRIVEYKPLLDGAIETASHKPDHCVVVQRDALAADLVAGRDLDRAPQQDRPQAHRAGQLRNDQACGLPFRWHHQEAVYIRRYARVHGHKKR